MRACPPEVIEALDAWLEEEKPDGVEVTSEDVARGERWARVRAYRDRLAGEDTRARSDEIIAAVEEALERSGGMDIVYVHPTAYGGSVAAVVRVGTPAYRAISDAYPAEEITPHAHIEPGMF